MAAAAVATAAANNDSESGAASEYTTTDEVPQGGGVGKKAKRGNVASRGGKKLFKLSKLATFDAAASADEGSGAPAAFSGGESGFNGASAASH